MNRDLFNQMVNLLIPYLDSLFARKAFVNLALTPTSSIIPHIEWAGSAQDFTVQLFDACIKYGDKYGLTALDALLVTASEQMGIEDADKAEQLRGQIATISVDQMRTWVEVDAAASASTAPQSIMRDNISMGNISGANTGIAIGGDASANVTQTYTQTGGMQFRFGDNTNFSNIGNMAAGNMGARSAPVEEDTNTLQNAVDALYAELDKLGAATMQNERKILKSRVKKLLEEVEDFDPDPGSISSKCDRVLASANKFSGTLTTIKPLAEDIIQIIESM